MDMIKWYTADSRSDNVTNTLGSHFWIYWVVTIPLTLLVVVGWRFWWSREKRVYDKAVADAIEKVERVDRAQDPC